MNSPLFSAEADVAATVVARKVVDKGEEETANVVMEVKCVGVE